MDRDFQILRFLFQQKIASLNTVWNFFFTHTSRNSCTKRMQKLITYGLVGKTGYNKDSKRLQVAYYLTQKGYRVIKDNLCLLRDTATFKSDSIEHDIQLSEIREKVSKLNSVERYYSENAIKNLDLGVFEEKIRPYKVLRSDAVLELNLEDESFFVALEYERERKQESKYRRKIRDYYLESSALAAFYICKEPAIIKTIRKVDKEVSQKFDNPKIYTILEKDFQNTEGKLAFRNSENGIFHI